MSEVERRSPNVSIRRGPITAIILHDTQGKTLESAVQWLTARTSRVSSHAVIGKDGALVTIVPDDLKAWHAGNSELWFEPDMNDCSLGLELVDDSDSDHYPDAQLAAAVQWCAQKVRLYNIWLNRIVGHQHIAIPRGRKVDPGPDFPWRMFLTRIAHAL